MYSHQRWLGLATTAKAKRDEAKVRELLGRWVSGLDPAIVYFRGEVVGLCDADAGAGSSPFILKVEP